MEKKDKLFQIADSQQGYFTSEQAETCGYSRPNFHLRLTSGEWTRELRGIYKLSRYPITDRPELVLWTLWSRSKEGVPQGIWSHETALDIHELSDVMPKKMHLSVPKKFRKRVAIPKILQLHYADISEPDIEDHQGYRVTTPLRTIQDIILEGKIAKEQVTKAIREAMQKGLISKQEAQKLGKYHASQNSY